APPGTARSDSSYQDVQQVEGRHQLLVFALGEIEFAVPVEHTTEIGMVPELTRLPHVPEWLLGITNLRGDIVSVVDMKNFLGMGPFDFTGNDRIILLRSLQEDICTAVIVNRIAGMQYVAEEDISRPDAGHQSTEPHIRGVFEMDGRSIAILDIESLLLSDDMQQFRAM
ncbi:MAG: purine-binding chemotaxis protein CheW, partial [Deltaproteobacteria bacterium]